MSEEKRIEELKTELDKAKQENVDLKARLETRDADVGTLEATVKRQATEIRSIVENGDFGFQSRIESLESEKSIMEAGLSETAKARRDVEELFKLHLSNDLADLRIKAGLDHPDERVKKVDGYSKMSLNQINQMIADTKATIKRFESMGLARETWGAGAAVAHSAEKSVFTIGSPLVKDE